MRKNIPLLLLFLLILSCGRVNSANGLFSQTVSGEVANYDPQEHYTKREVTITMRDGIKLHTTIYAPKDTSKKYPILFQRTPYSCKPYGAGAFRELIGPNKKMMEEGQHSGIPGCTWQMEQ